MHQLLLTTYHSSLNWSNPKYFLYFTKKSFFLHSLKIVICSRLLNFRLYVYAQELFIISWKKFHLLEHFSYPFVTEHHINLSLVFNPLFISSICCQSLVLFVTSNLILFFISKKWFYFFRFIFWHTSIPLSSWIPCLFLFYMLIYQIMLLLKVFVDEIYHYF